jgi:translation initiation factor 2 subunit 1
MTTATPEKTEGLKALQNAIEAVEGKITELGGVFNIQMAVSINYYFF